MKSIVLFSMYPELLKALRTVLTACNQQSILDLVDRCLRRISWLRIRYIPKTPYLGRLALKREAAGKVRVFAMVDGWTQWALDPLHRRLFSILKNRFPTDGTFDQLKPLSRVPWGKVPIFSYDLSSATDRLPIDLQVKILTQFFSSELAEAWRVLLIGREYKVPQGRELDKINVSGVLPNAIKYSVGQPMGALSSWAMLALTHHFIVHAAAWDSLVVSHGSKFDEYAVLGDDIVIWNKRVADRYLVIIRSLGVEVGLAKSIVSLDGLGLEFAKKTFLKGQDCSPVPLKELSSAHRNFSSLRSFAEKYSLDTLQILRFLGYGYRVDPTKFSSRVMRILRIIYSIPRTPQELRELFLYDFIYDSMDDLKKFSPDYIREVTLDFLWTELHDLLKRAESSLDDIRFLRVSRWVDRTFAIDRLSAFVLSSITEFHCEPWQKDIVTHINMLKQSIIHIRNIRERDLTEDIQYMEEDQFDYQGPIVSTLDEFGNLIDDDHQMFQEDLIETRSNWKPSMKIIETETGFKFWGSSKFTRHDTDYIISAITSIYEAQDYIDRIQLELIRQPRPIMPTDPKFEEEIRTLRLWTYWAGKMSNVRNIHDLGQLNLPKPSKD